MDTQFYQPDVLQIKSKKPIGLKKEYIGSTAQKKSNKITKFLINAFLLSVEATFHKNALIKNLVILFDFFCAVEPIYSFFKPIGFFDLIGMFFCW